MFWLYGANGNPVTHFGGVLVFSTSHDFASFPRLHNGLLANGSNLIDVCRPAVASASSACSAIGCSSGSPVILIVLEDRASDSKQGLDGKKTMQTSCIQPTKEQFNNIIRTSKIRFFQSLDLEFWWKLSSRFSLAAPP